mmetsp:Transcript_47243/g.88013  ORF Transcript_47243/g.88013 Transcript_47243/m.88013 type:complete len:83 (-) Transcript_47243:37-285(-)
MQLAGPGVPICFPRYSGLQRLDQDIFREKALRSRNSRLFALRSRSREIWGPRRFTHSESLSVALRDQIHKTGMTQKPEKNSK